ncbi:MAG: large subunit ribosomal protein [Thermotogota bacterium]|nr:large subunit ribosomal protein [Thermotogota bacterium]MDK2864140.1 large subunit ribosomal protein [Thermotogota bacterium]HCZ06886.1 50S ribosomal protein L18 [Thermotogota bacterium]
MIKRIDRKRLRTRRHLRVRKKISGTPERPRLCVFRSNKHIYAQIIDDTTGHTLCSASTLDRELRSVLQKTWNKEAAREVGKLIGKRALEKGITTVVFDRGGFKYHGRIKELADGAREAGLKF